MQIKPFDIHTIKIYQTRFDTNQIIYNQFQIKKIISQTNCKVYEALLLQQENKIVALKVVKFLKEKIINNKSELSRQYEYSPFIQETFFVSVALLKKLKQLEAKYVVTLYQSYYTQDQTVGFLTMEKLGITLSQHIKKMRKLKHKFTQHQLIQLFYEISLGIRQLHSHKIMHRNFQPHNIAWDQNTKRWKIISLGYSLQFGQSSFGEHTKLGTVVTMAPQFFNETNIKENNGKIKYCSNIDVWSLGVVYYFIATLGTYPFESYRNKIQMKEFQQTIERQFGNNKNQSLILQSGCSPKIINFIKDVLKINRQERMSIEDLFNHQIFSNLHNEKKINLPSTQIGTQEFQTILNLMDTQSKNIQNQLKLYNPNLQPQQHESSQIKDKKKNQNQHLNEN